MTKKFILSLFLLIFSFSSVFIAYAADIDEIEQNFDSLGKYLTLEYNDGQKILNIFSTKLTESLKKRMYSAQLNEENDAIILIRMANNQNKWNFLTFEYPLEITINLAKNIIDMVKLMSGTPSDLIGKIEKITVEKSVEYAMDEIFKSEVKVASGAIEGKYTSQDGEEIKPTFQYIITFQEIAYNENEVIIRFYSPESLEIPKYQGGISIAAVRIFASKENIKPFVLTAKGKMTSDYDWIGEPEIDVEYPEVVEDFGLKHVSVWERLVVDPIKNGVNDFFKFISGLNTSVFDIFSEKQTEIVENNPEIKEIAEEIKQIEENIEKKVEEVEKISQTDNDFVTEVEKLNQENKAYEEGQQKNIVEIGDNMTEEQMKEVLIAIYKELKKRNNELKQIENKYAENQQKNDKLANADKEIIDEEEEEVASLAKAVKTNEEKGNKNKSDVTYCEYNGGEASRNGVILNEVSWMGTHAGSDEWIELKNISNESIDLTGYQLLDKAKQIKIVFDGVILAPSQLFLLERTDDDSAPGVSADMFYTGSLANEDEALYLFNSSCELQDFVIADPDWPAGDVSLRKSMERNEDFDWYTTSSDTGTPKQENSEEIINPSPGGGGGEVYPVANAGTDQDVFSEDIVALDASASTGINLSYLWNCSDDIILNNNAIVDPTFTAPTVLEETDYTCTLTITDSNTRISTDTVQITVNPRPITYCSQIDLAAPLETPVIINEVAWMGTATSYADEWIELKNISDEEVSLEGYQLLDKENQIQIVFGADDTISAHGFYLLERTDDDSVPEISADKIYTGVLSDTDESLRLFNEECVLIDEVVADPDWPAGDTEEKKSMERATDLSWQTYSGVAYSTPRAENSIPSSPPEEPAPTGEGLVVAEVDDGYGNDGREYVKIFNQSGDSLPLCTEEECIYIAYLSTNENEDVAWNNPNLIYALPEATVENNAYYQIDFTGDNRGDVKITEDGDYFYPNVGSVCLFNQDITLLNEEAAEAAKIDCLGWTYISSTSYPNDFKEGTALERYNIGDLDQRRQSMKRKTDIETSLLIDTDDNNEDFEHVNPSIYTVPDILNFSAIEPADKTKVNLSWDYDSSLNPDILTFKVYYAKNEAMDIDNLVEIVPGEIITSGYSVVAVISDIEEGADYRFRVKIFEEGGNVSELSDEVFYAYFASFDNFKYAIYRYDENKTNHTSYIGPEEVYTKNNVFTVSSSDIADGVITNPAIDEYGNLYLIIRINGDQSLYSLDPQGNIRWSSSIDAPFAPSVYLMNGNIYVIAREEFKVFNYRGELQWEKTINVFGEPEQYLNFYNDTFYYICRIDNKAKVCKIGTGQADAETLIYDPVISSSMSDQIIITSDALYVVFNTYLKKIDHDGNELASKTFAENIDILTILGDKMLVSVDTNQYLVDLLNFENDPTLAIAGKRATKVTTIGSRFFVGVISASKLYFYGLDPETLIMSTHGSIAVNSVYSQPLIDDNQNIYLMSSGAIVGYRLNESDRFEAMFSIAKPSDISSIEISLVDNKLYYNNEYELNVLDF